MKMVDDIFQNLWIRCDEKLPKEDGRYIVTVKDVITDDNGKEQDCTFVVDAWFWTYDFLIGKNKKGWTMLNEWYDLTDEMRDNVIAWMPYPRPYGIDMENPKGVIFW